MSDAGRLFGNFQHASPLAIDLLLLTVMQTAYGGGHFYRVSRLSRRG
jgi:hypothetical protein